MANVFGGNEIVEIGVQIEKNGKDFYETLIRQSKIQKAKDIYKFLAEEEKKHIATFQKMLKSIQKYEPPEAYPDEYFAYLRALAGSCIFTERNKGSEIAKNIKDDREAINLGIEFEKDSILFYTEMKKAVPEYDQKTIDKLIIEEQDHLQKLSELKKDL